MIRSVAIIAGSNSLVQFLNLCAYPLLTYLYTPEDFGVFGMLTSAGLLFGVVVCWRLDTIIQIEGHSAEHGLLHISLILGTGGSILAGVSYFFYLFLIEPSTSGNTSHFGDSVALSFILMLIIFGNGFQPVCRQFAIKNKRYKTVARSQVLRVLTGLLVQISIGLIYPTVFGLLVGFTIGLLVSIYLIFPFQQFRLDVFSFKILRRGVATVRKNRNLIAIDSLNVFISNVTNAGLVLVVSGIYGSAATGIFLVTTRIIFVPIEVIGNAISSVYFQTMSQMVRDRNIVLAPYYQVLLVAAAIILPVLVVIRFFAEEIFGLFLPSSWSGVSDIATALSPLLAAKMSVATVGYTALSLKRPLLITFWNIFQLAALFAVSFITLVRNTPIETFVFQYGTVILAGAIVYLLTLRKALLDVSTGER